MAMMRRRGDKKPVAFYIIFVLAIVVSIAIAVCLPIDIYPIKVLVACALILGLSFLGVWLYAKKFRR